MKFLIDESGQGMVEYALILGLIVLVVLVAVVVIGKATREKMHEEAFEMVSDYSG